MRHVLQGVGPRIDRYFDKPWASDAERRSELVIIGLHGLDRAAIETAIPRLVLHLLAATPGVATDGSEAVDLAQTPGDIVFLSAADTELASLAQARRALSEIDENLPSLRLANMLQLGHHMSVDLYLEQTISQAKLVIVRLLGGRAYWPYGVEQLAEVARIHKIKLAFLPGDDQPDADLDGFSTLDAESRHRLWQFLVHGGPENAKNALTLCRIPDWVESRMVGTATL